jgi:Rrf2 family protein
MDRWQKPMRTLSKRTQYSLRALYALARGYRAGPKLIVELAEEESIPKKFLEQILLSLKSSGLVGSRKGRGGGYFLAHSPGPIWRRGIRRRASY